MEKEKEEKKYELIEDKIYTRIGRGGYLHRIRALKDFSDIHKGDLGGYVESESNLSQKGNCWIYDNARVFENAQVHGDSKVCDEALVYGNAELGGNSKVYEKARVSGNAVVFCSEIYGNAEVYGNAELGGNSKVYEKARVFGNSNVWDNAEIYGNARVYGNAAVYGNSKVHESVEIYGDAEIFDEAEIYGNVHIHGETEICGNAKVKNSSDFIVFENWWSNNFGRYFTWTKSNNLWKDGNFHGTGKALIERSYKESELSGKEYKKIVRHINKIIKEYEQKI